MKKNSSKGSVVIVEDDMLLSLVESRIIEKLGYTVIEKVQSGEKAVDTVRQLNPDAVVMDVSLKGEMNGIDAVKEIRKFSNVPVIFLSGSGESELIKSAKEVGYDDYLVKPIKADDMLHPLKKAVRNNSTKKEKVFNQAV